jgi:hypothetical protein
MTQYSVPSDDTPVLPEVSALQEQVRQLTHFVQEMQTQRAEERTPTPASHPQSNLNASPSGGPKVKLPEKFNGNRSRFRGFIHQLELVFSLRPFEYSSDSSKIGTFGTLLEGRALSWFMPFLESGSYQSTSWKDFLSDAVRTFDDPCRVLSAESRLQNLVQSDSVADYIGDFSALAAEVHWNESTLISHFRRGLSPSVLDMMVAHDIPGTLQGVFNLASRIDTRLWEAKQIKKLRHVPSFRAHQVLGSPTPNRSVHDRTPRPIPSVHSTPSDAMEIDSVRKGPLTKGERDRRMKLGLCLYCGNSGHRISDCPMRNRTSLNSVSKPSPKSKKDQGNGQGY